MARGSTIVVKNKMKNKNIAVRTFKRERKSVWERERVNKANGFVGKTAEKWTYEEDAIYEEVDCRVWQKMEWGY